MEPISGAMSGVMSGAPIPLYPEVRMPDRGPDLAQVSLPRLAAVASRHASSAARPSLRLGGLTLDKLTGAAQWYGKRLTLSARERATLMALMANAGRILSLAQLATLLDERVDAVEERVRALRAALHGAGVKVLPREASGLGYILWY
jgi:DNA-binding response OmpR family regulator